MAVEDTLRRVDADQARGDLNMARQRLRGLIGSFPTRLDLRERLAEVYRNSGDAAQAGRWSYLSEHRVPQEQEAFEKAFGGDPVNLVWALAWRGSEDDADTDDARRRLSDLRIRAERESGEPVSWDRPRFTVSPVTRREKVEDVFVAIGCFTVITVGATGALAAIVNGVRVIYGWVQ